MGLGPPSCDTCEVWLKLDGRWFCPICGKDSSNGYRHLQFGYEPHTTDVAKVLLFTKGKNPNVVDD